MERMPAQPPVALQAVWACDEPRSDSRSVADALSLDPVLAARVMRMANSVFCGVRSEVTNLARAVTVVGLASVRAVATSCAACVSGSAPEGFWTHAAATGTASQLIAHRFGVAPSDALSSAGLLHDLGVAILNTAVPGGWARVRIAAGGGIDAELGVFGVAHPEVAQRVLTAWRLPITSGRGGRCPSSAPQQRGGPAHPGGGGRRLSRRRSRAHARRCESDESARDQFLLDLDDDTYARLVARIAAEAEELGAVLGS